MKRYRLLISWQLWPELNALPLRIRRALYRKFDQLEETPDSVSEFQSVDENGRLQDGFIIGQLTFTCWIDFSERHVKVLGIGPADRVVRR